MSARTFAAAAALLALAGAVGAGSAEAPELEDAPGDCAVPYGNAYLDIVSAWVDGEDEASFVAHLRLAEWTEALGPGAGLAVTFEHQGVRWGVVGLDQRPLAGWGFWHGLATEAFVEDLRDAEGAFDPATATMSVAFPKSRFPHTDPDDRELRGFQALTADVRPALPLFAAGLDGNGRWIVCDRAEGTGTYAFASGEHAGHAPAEAPPPEEAAPVAPAATADPVAAEEPQATPLPIAVAVGALAAAAWTRRRRT